MPGHLTANTISAILARTLDLPTETAEFKHWRICDLCQSKLRQAIAHQAPWSFKLIKKSRLYGMNCSARWPLWMISSDKQLLALTFSEAGFANFTDNLRRNGYDIELENPPVFLQRVAIELREFLENGHPYHVTDLNFHLVKSIFARQVLTWTGLIPFGQTATYGQIAQWMGSPGAARGVGGALHSNPLALVVPCHRVIGSNGNLTGFGGGLEIKQSLLELEGSFAPGYKNS